MTDIADINISKLVVTTLYDPKCKSSSCWKYFGHLTLLEDNNKRRVLDRDKLYCSECLEKIKRTSDGETTAGSVVLKSYSSKVSCGNFTRHLISSHGIQEKRLLRRDNAKIERVVTEAARKARIATRKNGSNSTKTIKNDKWLLAKNLALLCCKSLIPFDYVADEGMFDFLKKYKAVTNEDDFPTRQTISSEALSDIYENTLNNLREKIVTDAVTRFALAFHSWNDKYRHLNYITFTLHYLTQDFELIALTLTTQIINGKITRDEVGRMFSGVIRTFELDSKIHAVTDPGRNVEREVALANIDHHLCLGHALHNLISDGIKGIPELDTLIRKSKNIVRTIRYRIAQLETVADEEFLNSFDRVVEVLEHEDNDPLPECDLILELELEDKVIPCTSIPGFNYNPPSKSVTPSRWYTVLEMLEVLFSNRDLINNMLMLVDELRLTQNEWSLLEDLLQLLRKIREAVDIVSTQKSCTINVALVFRSEIIDILNSNIGGESLIMVRLKSLMLTNVNLRFPVSKTVVLAALLDYRFMGLKKVDLYLESQNMSRASFLAACVKEIVNTQCEMMNEDAPSTSNDSSFLHKLSQKHSVNMCANIAIDPIEQECRRYISSLDPLEPKDGDLLAFWNSKKNTFPFLAALARTVLCLPATTTPSEVIFSGTGLFQTAKKSRLSPMLMNKMIFVHDNYEICCNSEEKSAVESLKECYMD